MGNVSGSCAPGWEDLTKVCLKQQQEYTRKTTRQVGFKNGHWEQFSVYYIDGNLNNVRFSNLKTVCSNCSKILYKEGVKWKQGDLVPDL